MPRSLAQQFGTMPDGQLHDVPYESFPPVEDLSPFHRHARQDASEIARIRRTKISYERTPTIDTHLLPRYRLFFLRVLIIRLLAPTVKNTGPGKDSRARFTAKEVACAQVPRNEHWLTR